MTKVRVAPREAVLMLVIATAVVTILGWSPGTPIAHAARSLERQVVLVLLPGLPYEDALRDPLLRELAGIGGIGLMTTSGEAQQRTQAGVSLGAGRSAEAEGPDAVSFADAGNGVIVDIEPFLEDSGDAEPGLLGTTLAEAARKIGYVDLRAAAGDPAMLLAMDTAGRIPLTSLNTFPVLSELPPEFLNSGAVQIVEEADLVVSPDPRIVPFALEHSTAHQLVVLVVTTPPSIAMRDRGDSVTPVVLAFATPSSLDMDGEPAGLTSGTTHREGVVSNVDVAPTVLELLDVAIPSEMVGSPITVSGDPPTDLHRRYLEWREVVTPVGQGVLGVTILSLLIGITLILRAGSSRRVERVVAVAVLTSVALLVMLVPASLLPTFSWPLALITLAIGGAALVLLSLGAGGRNTTGPVTIVAIAGLALVVLDVATGWRTGSTPLLGGSALDGERFFGLGNPYAGIVLAGAALGAARLRPVSGVGLIVAAAAFAGLPFLGADVGGCITLAVVAALWFGLNRWGELGWHTWALAAAGAIVALVALIVTHRLLPPGETHVSRTVSDAGGVLGTIDVFWQRLVLNLRLTSDTPSAWIPILGLPVWLAVALRPPPRLRSMFDAEPAWRRAIVVLALGGMLGYVLNDTFGMAGITFVFVSAAVVYPALAMRWKAGEVTETAPETAPAGG